MSHSVGYSHAAELGRIQRRDLYLFPDFPINLSAYKHRNLDSDCSIQIAECVGRRQGFHVLCTFLRALLLLSLNTRLFL